MPLGHLGGPSLAFAEVGTVLHRGDGVLWVVTGTIAQPGIGASSCFVLDSFLLVFLSPLHTILVTADRCMKLAVFLDTAV